jgi:catechol 2,3-dioxygenase-like lactoylglutathione lyase family enzyme
MTTTLGVAEAVLYVSDLDRAAAYYTEVLGLTLTAGFNEARFLQAGPDSTVILFNAEGIKTRTSVIPSHGATGEGHLALAVPAGELDAWRERLKKHGVAIEHEQEWSQGTHSIYFRDPDNNSLELIDGRHYQKIWEELLLSAKDSI